MGDTNIQTSGTTSDLAEFVLTTYSNWKQNRTALQNKWNSNNAAFRGVSEHKWKDSEAVSGWQSQTFINVTKQKVVSACALVVDMLLAGGKIPFMLKPAPWDRVIASELSPEEQEKRKSDIADMRDRIEQQLLDCNADRALIKNILSEAVYGETYAKRVIHEVERSQWQTRVYAGQGVTDASRLPSDYTTFEQVVDRSLAPAWTFVSVWDIFRDLETDDLQAGAGIIHRQLVAPHWLRGKKGKAYYLDEHINTVLSLAGQSQSQATHPEHDPASLPPALRDVSHRQNTILYLEFWGRVPADRVAAFEQESFSGKPVPSVAFDNDDDNGDEVECMVCVANDQVVRYARTTPKDRPFYRGIWEDSLDGQGAIGVADNAENAQFMLNGAVRAFEDNKKLSANLILGVKRRYLDGDFKRVNTGLMVDISEDCDDARKALQQVTLQDVGESLLSLIALAEKYADMDTLIPKLTQGLDVKEPQMRAYVAQQQVEKSGKYIGSVIRNNDETLIEPIVESFYDYNMEDPSNLKGKGAYVVKSLGFTSFQDRIERIEKLKSLLALVMSSEILVRESKVRWYLEEIAKALDLDPDEVLKTPEELQAEAAAAAEMPPDPMQAAQTAKLNAEATRAEADAQAKLASAETDKEKLTIERAKAIHSMTTAAQGEPKVAQNK